MSLRINDTQASTLELMARVNDTTVSHIVRQAIDDEITRRRDDKAFQGRLARMIDAEAAVLDRLR